MPAADDVFEAMKSALAPTALPIAIPGDLPTPVGRYPNWKLRPTSESKQSLGRHSIAFNALLTIRLTGEVSEPVSTDDDVLVAQVVDKLLAMKTLAERAIINSTPLFQIVQQLVSVTTQFAYVAQETRLAGIQSDYTFELFQTADDFFPLEVEDFAEIVAEISTFPGAGLTVALP